MPSATASIAHLLLFIAGVRTEAHTRWIKKKSVPTGAGTDFSKAADLQSFANDVFQQIAHAVAVTPFVVIPTDQLEEAAVERNT